MVHVATKAKSPQLCTVTLLGNLVAKPDIRYRVNPVSAVTEIVIATSSKWLDKKTNQYKEWTSFHHIKVEGELVEQALMHAEKGDIVLVHGYLSHIKPANSEAKNHPAIVHASFVQKFSKGFTKSVNQIYCSGQITSAPKLITTPNNKKMAQMLLQINQHVYVIEKQSWQTIIIEREVQIWGKEALSLVEQGAINDNVVIEGKLSYLTTTDKTQYIEAKTVQLLKN